MTDVDRGPSAPDFELFGTSHLVSVVLVVGAAALVPLLFRGLDEATTRRLSKGIALSLAAYRLIAIPFHAWAYQAPMKEQLPFQICGILFFLCAWVLWRRSYAAYEIAYFLTMAGTLQALITPDVRYAFPHREFLVFFASHGMPVFAVFWATFVLGFRPRFVSIFKSFGATLVYAALLVPVNALLDTNYMFLRAKPEGASLLDRFGPWPWYLVGAGVVALALFFLVYLPFAPGELKRRAAEA